MPTCLYAKDKAGRQPWLSPLPATRLATRRRTPRTLAEKVFLMFTLVVWLLAPLAFFAQSIPVAPKG